MLVFWLLLVMMSYMFFCHRYKKGYLYGFVLWYSILPESFGIRLSESVPIISVNRLLLIVLLFIYLQKNHGKLSTGIFRFWSVKAFFILGCLSVVINIIHGYSTINTLISFGIERFLVLIIVFNECKQDKNMAKDLVKYAVIGGFICALIGIIQFVTRINLADAIFQAYTAISLDIRFGFTRANSTIDNSITFGYFNVLMFILSVFLHREYNHLFYKISTVVFCIAVICSITRGAILLLLIFIILWFLYGAFIEKKWTRNKIIGGLASLVIVIGGVIYLYNTVEEFSRIVEATIRVFDSSFVTDQLNNNRATDSRLEQLSVVTWLRMNNRLLAGYGSKFLSDSLIAYNRNGKWWHIQTIDVGFAAMFAGGGLLLFTGYISMYYQIISSCLKGKKKKHKTNEYNSLIMTVMLFIIAANISSVFYALNICFVIYAMFFAILTYKNIPDTHGGGLHG